MSKPQTKVFLLSFLSLNSTDYADLRGKLHAPVRTSPNVVIHQTISELFLDTFRAEVELNQPYTLPSGQVRCRENDLFTSEVWYESGVCALHPHRKWSSVSAVCRFLQELNWSDSARLQVRVSSCCSWTRRSDVFQDVTPFYVFQEATTVSFMSGFIVYLLKSTRGQKRITGSSISITPSRK